MCVHPDRAVDSFHSGSFCRINLGCGILDGTAIQQAIFDWNAVIVHIGTPIVFRVYII